MQTTSTEKLLSRDFVLLFVATLLAWNSHYVLMPALPLYAAQRLQATPSQIGVLMGTLALAAIVSRLLAGYALDRWGRPAITVGALVLYGGVALVYGLAPTIGALTVLRFLRGIPFGMGTTACDTIASDLVPEARRGEGLGYHGLASTLAMISGSLIASRMPIGGRYGVLFALAGLSGLAAAALAAWIRCPPVRHATSSLSLASMFERRVGWVSLIMLLTGLGYGSLMASVGLYGAELQIGAAGLFFSLYAAGLLAARFATGRPFDRYGPGVVVGSGLGLLCASYAALALWQTQTGYLAASVGMGFGFGAVSNSMRAMAIHLVPAGRRGAANGTLYAMFDIGIVSGSALLGALAQAVDSYALVYLLVAGITLLALGLFFVVILPRYRVASNE
jgi:MFS family permease